MSETTIDQIPLGDLLTWLDEMAAGRRAYAAEAETTGARQVRTAQATTISILRAAAVERWGEGLPEEEMIRGTAGRVLGGSSNIVEEMEAGPFPFPGSFSLPSAKHTVEHHADGSRTETWAKDLGMPLNIVVGEKLLLAQFHARVVEGIAPRRLGALGSIESSLKDTGGRLIFALSMGWL